jgi:tRNA nucleotidyltransferase/poly(A) polymerase
LLPLAGIKLALKVSQLLKTTKVQVFKTYGKYILTMLRLKILNIGFVGARKESPFDSRNPVERRTLEDDQNRRDFTINALVSLNADQFWRLSDPFGGLDDLNKILRTP